MSSAFTAKERQEVNTLANLYSIIRTVDHLERAFVTGAVPAEEYEKHVTPLIGQFRTMQNALKDKYPDMRVFLQEQDIECPLAAERLLGSGVAATKLNQFQNVDKSKESIAAFEVAEYFITLNDALKLGQRAVDDILPLLRNLQAAMTAIPSLPTLPELQKVTTWLTTLNGMRASDSLDEDQSRQLSMDIEHAYTTLRNWLQQKA